MPVIYRRYLTTLALGGLLVMLAGCGGQPAATGNAPAGRMPRERQVSAHDLQKGQGTDICDQFTKPTIQAFKPPDASQLAILPGEHVRGAQNATTTIIEYGDFGCQHCDELATSLLKLTEKYPDLRVVFRHLPSGAASRMAAEASEAASAQGGDEAFWSMHDLLYARQAEWLAVSTDSLPDVLADYADQLGLDGAKVKDDLKNGTYGVIMDFAAQSAQMAGVQGAPSLYLNDLPMTGGNVATDERSLDLFVQVVRLKQTYVEAPPMVIDPTKDYAAWIVTDKGDIAVDLYADLAPQTVNNFIYLACTGFYDNITWHQVLPGLVAQTGDPTGTSYGGPAYHIPDEFEGSGLTFDRAGWLSMAHPAQADSAGSQFFITLGPIADLNGSFTIFGKVVSGLDVANSLSPRNQDVSQSELPPGDKLITVIVRQVSP